MALDTKYYYIHEGFVSECVGYKTRMTEHEYLESVDRITNNMTITPEFIGMLLGRAKPINEKVLCKVCHQPIKEEDSVSKQMEYTKMTKYINIHFNCLTDDEKEEYKKWKENKE